MSWQLYLCKFPNQIRKIFHLSAPCSLPISYLIFPCCVRSGLDSFLFFYLWQLIWWSGRGDSYTNQFHYIEAKINWNKKEEVFKWQTDSPGTELEYLCPGRAIISEGFEWLRSTRIHLASLCERTSLSAPADPFSRADPPPATQLK